MTFDGHCKDSNFKAFFLEDIEDEVPGTDVTVGFITQATSEIIHCDEKKTYLV